MLHVTDNHGTSFIYSFLLEWKFLLHTFSSARLPQNMLVSCPGVGNLCKDYQLGQQKSWVNRKTIFEEILGRDSDVWMCWKTQSCNFCMVASVKETNKGGVCSQKKTKLTSLTLRITRFTLYLWELKSTYVTICSVWWTVLCWIIVTMLQCACLLFFPDTFSAFCMFMSLL